MTNLKGFNAFDLQDMLDDCRDVGCCIGIIDLNQNNWKFSIYLGNQNLLVIFEKCKGIIKKNLEELCACLSSNGTSRNLAENNFTEKISIFDEIDPVGDNREFYKYRLNIYNITEQAKKMKPLDVIKIFEFNLKQIEQLELGDVISFERGFYHHHALLTDSSRMIVTHRSGEPENVVGSYITSSSLLGIPTEKAAVTEDHLIEIAGHRRMIKSNHHYDKCELPRSKEEIVNEARKRIGERGYSVTSRNCQHFVSECRNGTSISPEVQLIKSGAFYTFCSLIAGSVALLGYAGSKYALKKQRETRSSN